MEVRNDPSQGLTRWTPEIAAEVRRTQVFWISITVGVLVAFSLVFGLLVDPSPGGMGAAVGMRILLLMAAIVTPCIALILALVYLFDCWPAALGRRFLQEHFSISNQQISLAMRGGINTGGFWAAILRGAIVSWGFVSLGLLTWWAFSGKWSLGFPSAMIVVVAMQISMRARAIRKLASEE